MFSGVHFLKALQVVPTGAATVAAKVASFLGKALAGGGLTPRSGGGLTPHSGEVGPVGSCRRSVPRCCRQRLLESCRSAAPQQESEEEGHYISACSAMDFGRWIVAWLCSLPEC